MRLVGTVRWTPLGQGVVKPPDSVGEPPFRELKLLSW